MKFSSHSQSFAPSELIQKSPASVGARRQMRANEFDEFINSIIDYDTAAKKRKLINSLFANHIGARRPSWVDTKTETEAAAGRKRNFSLNKFKAGETTRDLIADWNVHIYLFLLIIGEKLCDKHMRPQRENSEEKILRSVRRKISFFRWMNFHSISFRMFKEEHHTIKLSSSSQFKTELSHLHFAIWIFIRAVRKMIVDKVEARSRHLRKEQDTRFMSQPPTNLKKHAREPEIFIKKINACTALCCTWCIWQAQMR